MDAVRHAFFSEQEYQRIADLFDLGTIQKIVRFEKGFQVPRIWATTDNGDFVISQYPPHPEGHMAHKSRGSLQYEIDLLNLLGSLPVPHYLLSINGNFIEDFERHMVTVYRFLPGKHPKAITLPMARQLGQFLGQFHTLGHGFRSEPKGRRKYYYLPSETLANMDKDIVRLTHAKLKAVASEVRVGVEKYSPPASLPEGPIWVDSNFGNELFEGEKLTGILDFGNMYIGPYAVDIGKMIMWNCIKDKKVDTVLRDEILKGYEEERKLSEPERAYLHDSVLYAIYSHIWGDLWHTPLEYVPESYTLWLVKTFLPVTKTY